MMIKVTKEEREEDERDLEENEALLHAIEETLCEMEEEGPAVLSGLACSARNALLGIREEALKAANGMASRILGSFVSEPREDDPHWDYQLTEMKA